MPSKKDLANHTSNPSVPAARLARGRADLLPPPNASAAEMRARNLLPPPVDHAASLFTYFLRPNTLIPTSRSCPLREELRCRRPELREARFEEDLAPTMNHLMTATASMSLTSPALPLASQSLTTATASPLEAGLDTITHSTASLSLGETPTSLYQPSPSSTSLASTTALSLLPPEPGNTS
ncbi:hypothetical protein BKA70DRAFT_1324085 [Coprinopsis sp. MPI-PUGE-AT-0042]|nr:hypothetical protein BKA70DRAFT_1324085 [Coprinopsis sp. MPI-PUGE-AT-0042]